MRFCEVELSPIKKKEEKMTKLQAKNNSTGRTSFRILQKTQQVDFELILVLSALIRDGLN